MKLANEPHPSFFLALWLICGFGASGSAVNCPPAPKRAHQNLNFASSSAIITAELDSSEYRVREGDDNVTVCVQTDIGLPEPVDIQLRVFELLEELNNATGT